MTKLDDLTIGEAKKLAAMFDNKADKLKDDCLWEIGEAYFIRTVTMHLLGRLEAVTDKELLLSSASWIADSGRFHEAINTGKLNEIEPFRDNVIIGRAALIDATRWSHKLPKEAK